MERHFDPDYWRSLNPDLTIGSADPRSFEFNPIQREEELLDQIAREGYFQASSVIDPLVVDRMRRGVEQVRNAGWPAVLTFVYDEFWSVFRGSSLTALLTRCLGPGYQQLPFFWAHFVTPGSKGWNPHLDGGRELDKMSVWLPLSDATLENGCMYVVRKNAMTEELTESFDERTEYCLSEVMRLLQYSKALPAPHGSLLGWSGRLIHWGSVASPTATPRISVAVEFVRPSEETRQLPLLDPSALPVFAERLQLIGNALRSYTAFEPHTARFATLAADLLMARA